MTEGTRYPDNFGDIISTTTRIPYMKAMSGDDFFQVPSRLVGVMLGAPELQEDEAVMAPIFRYAKGFIRKFMRTIKKAQITAYGFDFGYPPGAEWNPVNKAAYSRSVCYRDLFSVHECATHASYKHFYRYLNAVLNQPRDTTVLREAEGTGEPIKKQSRVNAEEQRLYWALRLVGRSTHSSADALFAVGISNSGCLECDDDIYQVGGYGGGDGTAAPVLEKTSNGWNTSSAITNSLAVGSIITDMYINGDLWIISWADEIDTASASATTGGLLVSFDRGATVTAVSGVTAALYALTFGAGRYWAAGKAGAIYTSYDALNWSSFTNALAVSSLHYTDIAHDPEKNYLYLAGYDATNSRAHRIDGGTNTVTDLTSLVNAGANLLFRVAVLEGDHVIFGGASGTVRENAKVSDGATFSSVSVAGTTSAIRALGGDKARTLVGAATNVYERSALTGWTKFLAVTKDTGTTIFGNINAGAFGETEDGVNYAVFVTNSSEVVALTTYLPDAA